MTKKEKIREAKLIIALKVIRTWADHYHNNWWVFQDHEHMGNLRFISKRCKEALGEK